MRFKAFVRPLLIRTHQTRVARHIGDENSGQLAIDAFRGQSGAPKPHGPNKLSALGAHSNSKRVEWHSPFGEAACLVFRHPAVMGVFIRRFVPVVPSTKTCDQT